MLLRRWLLWKQNEKNDRKNEKNQLTNKPLHTLTYIQIKDHLWLSCAFSHNSQFIGSLHWITVERHKCRFRESLRIVLNPGNLHLLSVILIATPDPVHFPVPTACTSRWSIFIFEKKNSYRLNASQTTGSTPTYITYANHTLCDQILINQWTESIERTHTKNNSRQPLFLLLLLKYWPHKPQGNNRDL